MDCPVPSYDLQFLQVTQPHLGLLMDPKHPDPMVLAKLNLSSVVTRCYTRPPHTYRHLLRVDPPEVTVETRCFDMWHLSDRDGAFQILSSSLAVLGIPPELHSLITDHVCGYAQRAAADDRNAGRRSVPLEVVIKVKEFHRLSEDDDDDDDDGNDDSSLERALAESEAAAGHGMVPASAAAVKKMLKRVRVHEDGEMKKKKRSRRRRGRNIEEVAMVSCAICMEDIPAGSTAAKMPCSHVFHSKCVVRWLKESHFCPVCRFELPTSSAC